MKGCPQCSKLTFTARSWNVQYRAEHEAVRVFRVEPKLLRSGHNTLTVTNTSGGDLTIQRLDLGLW